MGILGLAPDPISPWWILATIFGNKTCMDLDLNYIEALDPDSAKILKPWFGFLASDTLQVASTDPIYQLLVQYLELTDVQLACIYFAWVVLITNYLSSGQRLPQNSHP
jgi:hypothetical protein